MKISIVGHGPSMDGSGLGKKIDSFDKVVRLKGTKNALDTKDFGSKIDALCASTEVMGLFFDVDAEEYWAYPKNGDFSINPAIDVIVKLQKPVMIPLDWCNKWNNRFRKSGATFPNVSTGMAAILIAIHRWHPKEISLAGFDTLLSPEIKFSRTTVVPRTGVGAFPAHDWEKEHEFLDILRIEFDMKISNIVDSRNFVGEL